MSLDSNPFNNIIQLEEITHFQKPHHPPPKSILATHHNYSTPSSSFHDDDILSRQFSNKAKKVSYSPTTKDDSSPSSSSEGGSRQSSDKIFRELSQTHEDAKGEKPHSSKTFAQFRESHEIRNNSSDEESESDTEFRRDFTQLPTGGRSENETGSQDSHLDHSGGGGGGGRGIFFDGGVSDENLFPLPNDIEVTRFDVIFAGVVFLIHLGELVTDFWLCVWHYKDGRMWGCGLTAGLITTGAIAMLHQFGFVQPDQLERTFRKGKRMRILVNCFPLAATTFVSLEGAISAKKAVSDGMQSQQYFRISELSRCLSRIQSFFQAAPQAALQLIILMENFNDTSSDKAWFTFANIVLSLAVMTNANLPSKTDSAQEESPNKAAYLPFTRIFVGLRMFSSLGSRCMAITFLMLGCRCLVDHLNLTLNPNFNSTSPISPGNLEYFPESLSHPSPSATPSTFTGLSLLLFPRIIFTLLDYFGMRRTTSRNLEHYRDQPELGISSSHPIDRVPICNIFVGYLATIFFPVGDPFWLFWYLWCEAGIFMIFGNVAIYIHSCLEIDGWVAQVYSTVFVVVFLVIPCILPAARAAVKKRQIQKVRRILEVQIVEDVLRGEEQENDNEANAKSAIRNGGNNGTGYNSLSVGS